MRFSLENYLTNLHKAAKSVKTNGAVQDDLIGLGHRVSQYVDDFLKTNQLVRPRSDNGVEVDVANEGLGPEVLSQTVGADSLLNLMEQCQIPANDREAVASSVSLILNNHLGRRNMEAWQYQLRSADHSSNGAPQARNLSDLYPQDVVAQLQDPRNSQEAFGAVTDMTPPDMKVAITVAIMNFHARLIPRVLANRTTPQPNVSYTKEYLEIYDLVDRDAKRQRLVDLYDDPKMARNDLKRIVPMATNDVETVSGAADHTFIPASTVGGTTYVNGALKCGVDADILKLSLQDKYGYSNLNRTDLIADGVRIESLIMQIGTGNIFVVKVPTVMNRLTRSMNARDSADRSAEIRFRVPITHDTPAYTYVAAADTDGDGISGEWVADTNGVNTLVTDTIKTAHPLEQLVVDVMAAPFINLKFGKCHCLASAALSGRTTDGSALSTDGVATLLTSTITIIGYVLDARFSEENLRKTTIGVWSHRVPMNWDIPIGRNYVYDYAMGQTNSEENSTNLTKIIGIGQDDVALTLCLKTLDSVHDMIVANGSVTQASEDQIMYPGEFFVAGDKVRPSVFIGSLDFSTLNVIRDADRMGDIKQKAISYLTGVTSRLLQTSFLQQQLGGSTTPTFKLITSMEILGNLLGVPHIHNHMNKDDARNLGDGIEYVLVLPNGCRLEIVTSTFNYMLDKLVLWPCIKDNNESELNFAHNWDAGTMVAHYTVSGQEAHHRLFANIRELPIVTNPIGAIIDVAGMDVVSGISLTETLRPRLNVSSVSSPVYTYEETAG